MPLPVDEIEPGVVAILDAAVLVSDKGIRYSEPDAPFRSGPFVCLQVNNGECLWLQLTKQADRRGLRLKITNDWKVDGSDLWQNGETYVHDARRPFIGPLASFSAAAANELPHQPHNRPRVSRQAIEAALEEIRRFGGETL